MSLVVKISAVASRALHGLTAPTEASKRLQTIIETAGGVLKPLHPGTQDPELLGYFTVEVKTAEDAARIVEKLQNLEGVEAAYVKPLDMLP